MKRGSIWWINFDPAVGGEIQKTRPAIIVCNNIAADKMNRVQVVPLTSNSQSPFPGESYVQVRENRGKALAHQLTTVSKKRLVSKIGTISDRELEDLENAIKLQLGLG
jgi:mRNA interferase MazF